MEPLIVRAVLAAGVAHAAPWAPSLDGILAAQLWAARKDAEIAAGRYRVRALHQAYPVDLELPLARCPIATGPQWHWLATCGMPEELAGPTRVHTWTGRLDARDLERVAAALPKVVSARQGRYRDRRMPLLVTVCRSMLWRAVGDPEQIRQLLEPVATIGKKRSSGEGQVLRWQVHAAPHLPILHAGHLHPDGSLGRPTPAACQQLLNAELTGGFGTSGVRPPYMHHSRQHEVHLPALLDTN